MTEQPDPAKRFGGKSARKILLELYGQADIDRNVERYARLGELAAGDAAAAGAGSEAKLRWYSAPGRTELGGNHTDHNRGRVLCAAVRLDAVACVARTGGSELRLFSQGYAERIAIDLTDLAPRSAERGRPEALVRGVAKGLADRGIKPPGFLGRIHSTVLPGSGLSSSASFEVLMGTVMADLANARLAPVEIAKIGRYAENEYFGKPCGLMDQTASAVGGIVAIDFADPAAPKVKRVDFDFEEAGYALVVVNTGGSHADLTASYASIPVEMMAVAASLGARELRDVAPEFLVARGPEIRATCGDRALLRAIHFVSENARVPEMVEALKAGELKRYFKLVRKSGDSSWKLLQNVYRPEAPSEQGLSLALALSADYLGKDGACRVHGGGFAGTIQAYVPAKLLPGYTDLMDRYFGPASVVPVSVRSAGAIRVF